MGWIVYREGIGEDSRVHELLFNDRLSIARDQVAEEFTVQATDAV